MFKKPHAHLDPSVKLRAVQGNKGNQQTWMWSLPIFTSPQTPGEGAVFVKEWYPAEK